MAPGGRHRTVVVGAGLAARTGPGSNGAAGRPAGTQGIRPDGSALDGAARPDGRVSDGAAHPDGCARDGAAHPDGSAPDGAAHPDGRVPGHGAHPDGRVPGGGAHADGSSCSAGSAAGARARDQTGLPGARVPGRPGHDAPHRAGQGLRRSVAAGQRAAHDRVPRARGRGYVQGGRRPPGIHLLRLLIRIAGEPGAWSAKSPGRSL
jgi:hypothetical protein